MLLLPLAPFLIWAWTPPGLHPYLAVCGTALLAFVLWRMLRQALRERAEYAANQPLCGDYRWRRAWDAAAFTRQLRAFLSLNGWQVLGGAPVDEGRVGVIAQKGGYRLAMLYVRNRVAGLADLAALEALRAQGGGAQGALISREDAPALAAARAGRADVLLLRIDALTRLDDIRTTALHSGAGRNDGA